MPSTHILKRDWEKDHVYLVQFPRAGSIPSASPYALKLETWLRIVDIPYTNINNEFKKNSNRGQIPFIELNGRQHADSTLIIEHLTETFNKTEFEGVSPSDKAIAQAFGVLAEHHLLWIALYSRGQDFSWLATDKGFAQHISGVKAFAFKHLLVGQLQKKVKSKVESQGIGKLTREEILSEAKKDITAISNQLADKAYLLGSSIRTVDATIFAVLAQFLYTPQFSEEIKKYIEETPNLINYFNRIKDQYWPDWDEILKTLRLDTTWKSAQ